MGRGEGEPANAGRAGRPADGGEREGGKEKKKRGKREGEIEIYEKSKRPGYWGPKEGLIVRFWN